MKKRLILSVTSGLGIALIAALAVTFGSPAKASAAGNCTVPTTTPASTSTGTDTISVSVPSSNTYTIWLRMKAGSSSNNSVLVNIDNGSTCVTAGGSQVSTSSWTWTNKNTSNATMSVLLNAGNHTIVLSAGNNSGVSVDRLELLTDTTCIPNNSSSQANGSTVFGDNCAPSAPAAPTASFTSPSAGSTVNGTVTIAVNAGSAAAPIGIQNVVIKVGNTTLATITPPATVESPSGSKIPDNTNQIIDSGSHVWTLSGGQVYRDGVLTCSSDVDQVLYFNQKVYQHNTFGDWWGPWNNSVTFPNGSDPCSSSVTNPWGTSPATAPTGVPTLPQQTSPYSASWNTASGSYPNGSYTITATVTDTQNQTKTITQTVTVNNQVACTANPSAPTNVNGTSPSPTQLNITWTASTPGAGCTLSNYSVYQGSTLLGTASGTSFNATGLQPNTSYSITVKASDTNGHTATSTAKSLTTAADTTAPTAPATVTATSNSASAVNLTWTASTDAIGVTGYKIYRANGTGTPTTLLTSVSGSTLSYQDNTVNPSTQYTYAVSAIDAAGNESAKKNSSAVTTQAPPAAPQPTAPTNLRTTTVTYNTVVLAWNASSVSSGTIAGYHVYRSVGSGSATRIGTVTGVNTTSYTDTGLAASTTYKYYVVAYVDNTNVSNNSSTLNVTTQAAPVTCTLAANINCPTDNVVGPVDLSILLSHFNKNSGALRSEGDINGDGKVNATDLSMLLTAWGQTE